MMGNEDIKKEIEMKEEYPEGRVIDMATMTQLIQLHQSLGDRLLAMETNIASIAARVRKLEEKE